MRSFCRSFVALLLVSCPLLSKAVVIRVQDPTYDNFTLNPVSPTSFSFGACGAPNGPYLDHGAVITSAGCAAYINQTGATIESITLTFANSSAVQNSGMNNIGSDLFTDFNFTAPSDPANPNEDFTYSFSGSGLFEGEAFVITEDGVADPSQFPVVDVSFTTNAATPEPTSLLLMATGLAGLSGLYFRRRLA